MPFHTAEVFLFLFFLDLALALHGKGVVVDANINVIFVNAGDFDLQRDVVLILVDIDWRCEAGGGQRFFRSFGAK